MSSVYHQPSVLEIMEKRWEQKDIQKSTRELFQENKIRDLIFGIITFSWKGSESHWKSTNYLVPPCDTPNENSWS